MCLEKQNPVEASIAKEESEKLKKYLSIILSPENKILTERQCEYLKLYYIENKTFADIGKQFNITREAVRQGIKKSIEKIRELDNINV